MATAETTGTRQAGGCASAEVDGMAVAACFAVAQGVRSVLAEDGFDVINVHLQSGDAFPAAATGQTDLPATRLFPVQLDARGLRLRTRTGTRTVGGPPR